MNRALLPYLLLLTAVLLVTPWIGAESLQTAHVKAYLGGEIHPDGTIFFTQRIPRTILALLAGGTLAVVGASFQVLFRNPLVEPFTLGVTGGAAVGAFVVISIPALQVSVGPVGSVQLFALIGAFACLGLIYSVSVRPAGVSTGTLLLAGITIGILCGGVIMLISYLTNPYRLTVFHRWMMGGLDVVGFRELGGLMPFLLPGLGLLFLHGRELNHLALGEEMALGHGVDVSVVQRDVFLGGGLATAAVVSLVGPIGFVGLIVPHAVRRLSGFDQQVVLPASFLLGGTVLALCDCGARTVLAPTEMPVGIVTAIFGAPLFIYLLLKTDV